KSFHKHSSNTRGRTHMHITLTHSLRASVYLQPVRPVSLREIAATTRLCLSTLSARPTLTLTLTLTLSEACSPPPFSHNPKKAGARRPPPNPSAQTAQTPPPGL
ncbi:uncharacterized protein TM35_000381000, partial [Trypanosoma theileri]